MIQVLHIIQSYNNPNWTLLKDLSQAEIKQVVLQTPESQKSTEQDGYLQTIEISQVQPADFHLIHAHSWLTDGNIARELHQKLGLSYCVTLREEDIQHIRKMSLKMHSDRMLILQDAAKVIFPHPQFFHAFNQALSDSQANQLFSKTITIFRSINPLFLQEFFLHKPVALVNIRLLYIVQHEGYEEDISIISKAVKEIKQQNLNVSLTLAAATPTEKLRALARRIPESSTTSFDSDKALMELYRNHDMVLMIGDQLPTTSHYVEAISQGMPVIFSRNSCLDGIFNDQTCRIEKDNAHTLAEKIIEISQRYATAVQHISELRPLLKFHKQEIVQEYQRVYSICDSLQHRSPRL
ncbi:MAG: glycosyltransferase [Bacteroidales bacterium]|nr:glycosyltransferase [Bacteroidales bacterium]